MSSVAGDVAEGAVVLARRAVVIAAHLVVDVASRIAHDRVVPAANAFERYRPTGLEFLAAASADNNFRCVYSVALFSVALVNQAWGDCKAFLYGCQHFSFRSFRSSVR